MSQLVKQAIIEELTAPFEALGMKLSSIEGADYILVTDLASDMKAMVVNSDTDNLVITMSVCKESDIKGDKGAFEESLLYLNSAIQPGSMGKVGDKYMLEAAIHVESKVELIAAEARGLFTNMSLLSEAVDEFFV